MSSAALFRFLFADKTRAGRNPVNNKSGSAACHLLSGSSAKMSSCPSASVTARLLCKNLARTVSLNGWTGRDEFDGCFYMSFRTAGGWSVAAAVDK